MSAGPKIVLTIDWRTAAAGWPGGQIYLLDLGAHKVLDHYVGPLTPAGLMEPGGWTGFRGVFCRAGKAFVADADAIRQFSLAGDVFRFERAWTTRRWYDIHDVWPEDDGSYWITATNTDEVVRVAPHHGYLIAASEVWDASADPAVPQPVPARGNPHRRFDLHHVNSVATRGKERWALLHRGGKVVRFSPGPTFVHPATVQAGHSIRLTPQGLLLVLDTRAERVVVLSVRNPRPVRTIDCGARRLAPKVDPNTGKRAEAGWLRGCCVLDDRLAVVGTSPAQLFVVDYLRGTVEDHWEVNPTDVRASTFGIDVVR